MCSNSILVSANSCKETSTKPVKALGLAAERVKPMVLSKNADDVENLEGVWRLRVACRPDGVITGALVYHLMTEHDDGGGYG